MIKLELVKVVTRITMSSGQYTLKKQIGGIGYYASVVVSLKPSQTIRMIEFSGHEFDWLKDVYGPDAWEWPVCEDYRRGASRGVQYALDNCSVATSLLTVIIETIEGYPAHTSEIGVAFAACFATWDALDVEGKNVPLIQDGRIIFLDT